MCCRAMGVRVDASRSESGRGCEPRRLLLHNPSSCPASNFWMNWGLGRGGRRGCSDCSPVPPPIRIAGRYFPSKWPITCENLWAVASARRGGSIVQAVLLRAASPWRWGRRRRSITIEKVWTPSARGGVGRIVPGRIVIEAMRGGRHRGGGEGGVASSRVFPGVIEAIWSEELLLVVELLLPK